jgi:hypothetical protein
MARRDVDGTPRFWAPVPIPAVARAESPIPPAPGLAAWFCARGHKLAYLALAPGSIVRIYCRECKCWYEKEVV